MLKFAITLLTLYCLLIVIMVGPAQGQSQTPPPQQEQAATGQNTNQNKSDLKQVFDNETEKMKAESGTFDADKAQRDNATQKAKKKVWTTKNKLLLTAAIIGFVGLMFVLIKYGKNCLRSSPPGCTPGVDENCTCEEYERRIPQQTP